MTAQKAGFGYILLILAGCLPSFGDPAFVATRYLPPSYTPNVPLTVTLEARFNPGDCGGAVEDYVPFGWRVSNIRGPGSGIWNSNIGRVVWAPIYGPLCGGLSGATLTYDLTPPPNATGSYLITGEISVDGYVSNTIGNSSLYPRPVLLGVSRSSAGSALAFTAASNVLYSLQRSPSLISPQWVTIGTNYRGSGEILQAVDTAPTGQSSMFYRVVLQATAATRLCPVRYGTNGLVAVQLTLSLTPEVCEAKLTETLPAGWQITDVSSGGSVVSTQIVWTLGGPACGGPSTYTLTYTTTAPPQETAVKAFSGEFVISGVTNEVLGDREILPPFADVPNLVTRTLPANYLPGTALSVDLAVSLAPGSCSAVVTEIPPAGWVITGVQGGDGWANPQGNVQWTPSGPACGGVSTHHYTYTLLPPSPATGTARFTGSFAVDGYEWSTAGDSSLSVAP